jgi:hypothetical protein
VRSLRWLLLLLLVLVGCPKRADSTLQVSALLQQADIRWHLRGRNGLDVAGQPLLLAFGLAPADPRVLWRIARWRIAEGLIADDRSAARSSFAEARAIAAGCLDHDPNFAVRRAAGGWAEALDTLSPERAVCASWTALAWARWAEVHGAEASALDLPALDALVAAGRAADAPDVRAVADWAAGITLATRPDWAGRDLEAAGASLRAAAEAEPEGVLIWVDLWRLVVVRASDFEAQRAMAAKITAMAARGPEERRAIEVVAAGP